MYFIVYLPGILDIASPDLNNSLGHTGQQNRAPERSLKTIVPAYLRAGERVCFGVAGWSEWTGQFSLVVERVIVAY